MALLRAHMGMLNHHSFKLPFSPVFAILRVKPFGSTINTSVVVDFRNWCLRGVTVKGSMLVIKRSRVREPPEGTLLKFSLFFRQV